ncbi:MAG TPA: thioredoxin family protein [Candidatus Cloacimonadota bacterium]|nr:thioredoxin family protein [Candidatus Cloacimonadota bacterium]HQB40212.1 thioredoxin family protein [Candidatus Cloacimonadota bacterium]
MKLRFVILLLFLSVFAIACAKSSNNLVWLEDYNQALKQSTESKLPILINFTGSDWCIWCKRLSEEVFDTKEFENYAKKNLILLKIDFPQKIAQTEQVKNSNRALAQKYQVQGFPTIVLTDSKGNIINVTGYQKGGASAYIDHLKSLLKK